MCRDFVDHRAWMIRYLTNGNESNKGQGVAADIEKARPSVFTWTECEVWRNNTRTLFDLAGQVQKALNP